MVPQVVTGMEYQFSLFRKKVKKKKKKKKKFYKGNQHVPSGD